MTGDCVGVDIARAGRLLQQKPAFGGNIVSVIMGSTTPQLATVRPRMYEPLEPREDGQAEVRKVELGQFPVPRLQLVERRASDGGAALDEAAVIVCAGSEVDFLELEQAATRENVAVGGSLRSGLPRRRKIGLLGRPVAPRLYIAVGVEDEPEHWAGSVKAGVVVSIGEAVPAAADVSVAGKWNDLVPVLLDAAAVPASSKGAE
jgi:electron transfer flavoprotein alpha subunit